MAIGLVLSSLVYLFFLPPEAVPRLFVGRPVVLFGAVLFGAGFLVLVDFLAGARFWFVLLVGLDAALCLPGLVRWGRDLPTERALNARFRNWFLAAP